MEQGEEELVHRDEEGHDHGSEPDSWLNLQIKRIVTAPRNKESALRSMKQCGRGRLKRMKHKQIQLLQRKKERKVESE